LEHGSCLEKLKRYAKINEICESLQFLSQTSLSMAKSKIKPTENKGKIVVVQAEKLDSCFCSDYGAQLCVIFPVHYLRVCIG
jgi:hypothetical protein